MEEKKSNKGFIWLIVILCVLVFGLIGYVVYDKLLKVDKTIPNNETTTITTMTTTIKEETNNVIKIFNSLPQENDSSVLWEGDIYNLTRGYIDFNTNFKNLEKNEYGFNISYSCELYNENNTDESIDKCTKFKLVIDGKDNDIFANFYYGLRLIFTETYIITYEGAFAGHLRIFDKNGKEIFKEYIGTDFIIKIDEETYYNEIEGYNPIIKDDKLYYVKYEKDDKQTFNVNSYDFNTHKTEHILNFDAEIGVY